MKTYLFCSVFCLVALACAAQSTKDFTFALDHDALSVKDVNVSAQFYKDVLGLKEMEDAAKNPGIRWMVFRDGRQLHLIQAADNISTTKTVHFSLAVKPFDHFVAYLKANNIPYSDWVGNANTIAHRPDGIQQVYIQDPDGYWIEINDVKRK